MPPEINEPPAEHFEPEIERLLTIPKLISKSKDAWEAYLKPEDIESLSAATLMEKKNWFLSSVLERKLDEVLDWLQQHNFHLRQIEAEQIREKLRHEREHENQRGLVSMWGFIRWTGIVAGGVTIAFLIKKWLTALFP